MDALACTHLYLALENPPETATQNGARLSSHLTLCLLPLLMAGVLLESSTPALAVLHYGSTGTEVVRLQQELKDLGYFPSYVPATGYFGYITREAVMKFQQAQQLPADGVVGSSTSAALVIAPDSPAPVPIGPEALRLGTQGASVKQLQMELAALGYYTGKVDGNFDATTEHSVRKFQGDSCLEIDGIVGVETRQVLQEKVDGI